MSKYSLLQHPNFFEKSHNAEKIEKGTLCDFSTFILSQKHKQIEGDPLEKKDSEKSLTMPKKLKRGPFGLVRYCMIRGKPFWFSSLSQQGQFKTL